ncbi:hypothetical protein CU098_007324 [Rhizopus stolonifer]|uniref:Uncharacterized protein n=1 Tax=Rhizopus stolonifer TaxID=4846 RepID=A0A367JK28_RHIST|nr:hypothetical protein CU098_007324 [Rhizopus stolonifer]
MSKFPANPIGKILTRGLLFHHILEVLSSEWSCAFLSKNLGAPIALTNILQKAPLGKRDIQRPPEVWSALIQARRNGQLKHVERILGPFKKNELNYYRDAVMAFSDTIVSVDITDDGAKGSGYNKIRDLFDEDQYEPRRRYAYMSGSEEEYVRRRNGDYVSEDSDSDTNTYSNGEYYAFLKDLEHLKALKEAVLERSSKITLKDVTNVVDVCPHIKIFSSQLSQQKSSTLFPHTDIETLWLNDAPVSDNLILYCINNFPRLKGVSIAYVPASRPSPDVLQRLINYISRTDSFKLYSFELKEAQPFIRTCFETMMNGSLSVSVNFKPNGTQTISVIVPEAKAYQLVDYGDLITDLTIDFPIVHDYYALNQPCIKNAFATCSQLRKLCVKGFECYACDCESRMNTSIVELNLDQCNIISPAFLNRISAQLPNLRKLDIERPVRKGGFEYPNHFDVDMPFSSLDVLGCLFRFSVY